MENFIITINSEIVNQFKEINIIMAPGLDVMDVAEKLSIVYPNHNVAVSMHARNRRVYVNGKCLSSNPDLSKFYDNVDDTMAWDWSCYGKVRD